MDAKFPFHNRVYNLQVFVSQSKTNEATSIWNTKHAIHKTNYFLKLVSEQLLPGYKKKLWTSKLHHLGI